MTRPHRNWLLLAVSVAFLLTVGIYAQLTTFTPLNPLNLTAQTQQPSYVWNTGTFGADTSTVSGNSTTYGTTLLLNTVVTNHTATASYVLSFSDLRDLHGYATQFTIFVPGAIICSSNDTPVVVTVGDLHFFYNATQPENFSWYSHNPAYVPENSDLVRLPETIRPYAGNYEFIPFTFNSSTLAYNTSVPVSIQAPALGQIYIFDIVLSTNASFLTYVQTTSESVGLAVLPVLVAVGTGVFWFFRRFSAAKFAGTLAAAFCLRIGLAPILMHSDVSIMIRFSQLFYNYHLVNLQTWTYGLLWLGTIYLPPAPLYAVGVSPSFAEWDLLLKLPGIIADLMTFLVLIRLLLPFLGERKAYVAATIGWLFNPLVIYFSSAHGLGESVVALFLSLTAYGLLRSRGWSSTVNVVLATLTIIAGAFALPVLFFRRGTNWLQRIVLIAAPILVYLCVYTFLYSSTSGFAAYLGRIGESGSLSGLPLGYSTTSPMSYLFLPYKWLGVFVSPFLGLAVLAATCVGFALSNVNFADGRNAIIALYGSICAFFCTYEVFYSQHLIWAVPLLVAATLFAPRVPFDRGLIFVWATCLFALIVNYLSFYNGDISALLAIVLFSALLVPLVLWIPDSVSTRLIGLGVRPAVCLLASGMLAYLVFSWPSAGIAWVLGVAFAGLSAVSFLYVAWGESSPMPLVRQNRLWSEAFLGAAIILPFYLVYSLPTSAPAQAKYALLVVIGCVAFEILLLLLEWVRGGASHTAIKSESTT